MNERGTVSAGSALATEHVGNRELGAYLNGALSVEESEAILYHLLSCPDCEQRLREIERPSREVVQASLDHLTDSQYVLTDQLALGGQATVYLARDKSQRLVVVKHFRKSLLGDSRFVPCWRSEFENSQAVLAYQQRMEEAGGIAQVFDLFESDDDVFLVREHIDGTTLEERLSDGPARLTAESLDQYVEWIQRIAENVHDAHRLGILHGDLKPSNVIIRDSDNEPVLIDFGISVQRQHLTDRNGIRAGTLNFMAPEVVRRDGASLTPRSEVWSLGVMLHLLVHGNLPFELSPSADTTTMLNVMQHGMQFPPANQLSESPELLAIVKKCLEVNPQDRYADAGDLADALRAWRVHQELVHLTQIRAKAKPRRASWVVIWSLMLLAVVSISLSYSYASAAWTLKFSWMFAGRIPVGPIWECLRTLIALCAYGHLIDVHFRPAFDRLFLWLNHLEPIERSRSVDPAAAHFQRMTWLARGGVLSLLVVISVLVTRYHLVDGPHQLAAFAATVNSSPSRLKLTENEQRLIQHEVASGDRVDLHYRAYALYLPYSLINFSIITVIACSIGLYSSRIDSVVIRAVKDRIVDAISNGVAIPVDSSFRRFRAMCRDRSQKYLLLAAVSLGLMVAEYWISNPAETAMSWSFLAMLAVLTGLFTWLFYLMLCYGEVYDACATALDSEKSSTAEWLKRNSAMAFVGECFLRSLAGRWVLASFVFAMIAILPGLR